MPRWGPCFIIAIVVIAGAALMTSNVRRLSRLPICPGQPGRKKVAVWEFLDGAIQETGMSNKAAIRCIGVCPRGHGCDEVLCRGPNALASGSGCILASDDRVIVRPSF